MSSVPTVRAEAEAKQALQSYTWQGQSSLRIDPSEADRVSHLEQSSNKPCPREALLRVFLDKVQKVLLLLPRGWKSKSEKDLATHVIMGRCIFSKPDMIRSGWVKRQSAVWLC